MNEEEARAALKEARLKRIDECWREIQAALDRYQCQLTGAPGFSADGRVIVQVGLAPKDAP